MVYNAANSQQSNTYQYHTDKQVRKPFEVPTYIYQLLCLRALNYIEIRLTNEMGSTCQKIATVFLRLCILIFLKEMREINEKSQL